MPRNRVQHQKGLSDDAFERLYPDEEACRSVVCLRWPEASVSACAHHSIVRSVSVNCCTADSAATRHR